MKDLRFSYFIKKSVLLIMIMGILGCSDDDSIDCALFDPAFPALFIKLVDASGANLIENGSINAENIKVEGAFANAGFIFNPANEEADSNATIRKFDNTLQLFIPGESTFQYTIYLSDEEAITVDFSSKLTRIECGLSFFTPVGSSFGELELEVTAVSPLQFLVLIPL